MKKLVLSFFMMLAIFSVALAQERTISGTVTSSEDGLPIPGASVRVKGIEGAGTSTSANGKYTIKVSAQGKTLVVTSVGFAAKEVAITSGTMNIQLNPDSKSLGEVVVTGVGVATDKRKTAIAVESISSKNILQVPSASLDQGLIGKVAGAQISSTSG